MKEQSPMIAEIIKKVWRTRSSSSRGNRARFASLQVEQLEQRIAPAAFIPAPIPEGWLAWTGKGNSNDWMDPLNWATNESFQVGKGAEPTPGGKFLFAPIYNTGAQKNVTFQTPGFVADGVEIRSNFGTITLKAGLTVGPIFRICTFRNFLTKHLKGSNTR
jgi:hypothetical protein